METQDIINEVKAAGWDIRFTHKRAYKQWALFPDSNGGKTQCTLKAPTKTIKIETEAKCHKNDTYVRKMGSNLAANRAYEVYKIICPLFK